LYFVDVDNVALSSELKYIKGGNFLLTFWKHGCGKREGVCVVPKPIRRKGKAWKPVLLSGHHPSTQQA
jgi:hypothetical protein